MSLDNCSVAELLIIEGDAPMKTEYGPASAIQEELEGSNEARSFAVSVKVITCVSPGFSNLVLTNALSSLAGFLNFWFGALT